MKNAIVWFVTIFVLGDWSVVQSQPFVQFSKTPSGDEELFVAKTLEECHGLLNAQNLDGWLTCFSDDAKIDSRAAQRIVDKKSYRVGMMRPIRALISVTVKQAEITLDSPTRATVLGILESDFKGAGKSTSQHRWVLEKRNDKWLIVETKYLSLMGQLGQ